MAQTINLTRACRVANDSGISGAESMSVESEESPSQTISAGVEEQCAIGVFKDHQLKSISLICDQDVEAQFLGVRYAILDLNVVGPDTITYTGDLEQEIFAGDLVRIEGTVADDGIYLVTLVNEAVGTTTLTIADGTPWPAGGGGAVGTFARVCSHQVMGYTYDIATAAVTGAITVVGDITDKFAAGDFIIITGSTGNDGIWEILTATYAAPDTTLVVGSPNIAPLAGLLPDATNDGDLYKVRPAIELTANVPFLWGYESGQPNPFQHPALAIAHPGDAAYFNAFRGDVAYCMVNNAGTVNAEFEAIIAKDAIIF